MSTGFEVTEDDVQNVFAPHKKRPSQKTIDRVLELVEENEHEVEKAWQYYDDLDNQTTSVYDTIEDICIREGILKGPKQWHAPTEESADSEEDDFDEEE